MGAEPVQDVVKKRSGAEAVLEVVKKRSAAETVFERLAEMILAGELRPGEAMPAERVFAERFGVSPIIVRQAVHRLAELGLVQTRQGSSTIVNDPAAAADLRVIELSYRLGPSSESDVRDLFEVQVMRALGLVQVAELHASDDELAGIGIIVEDYAAAGAKDDGIVAFEQRFWGALAEIGGNRFYRVETAWWYRLLEQQPRAQHPVMGPPEQRIAFYRELSKRLQARSGAARFYLDVVTPVLASFRGAGRARKRGR